MKYLLPLILLCSGCIMTRVPIGNKYLTRIAVGSQVQATVTVTDPESGFTITYGCNQAEGVKAVTSGITQGMINTIGITAGK